MSWINEAAVPNHNGNGFPQLNDPSAVAGTMMDPSAFMGNPAQFNPQFANPQQMIMPNGPMRNASPGFSNPMYQTNPVVPSKRPRPREDSIGQSPRPAPGMLPTSRAETPQQSQFPGFQQPGMQQPPGGQPSPYPHLQPNGSANATPSPIMANQMRPGSVPQRVATTSPHPFSPGAPQFPQQSPIPSEHSGTPQPFMQQNFQQNFNPQFTPGQSPARPSPTPNAMAGQMMPQQMGQMPPQMGQMPGQMPGQMQGQMPGQMAGQMPNQMFPQNMAQGRNMDHSKMLQYQMHLQNQQRNMGMQAQQAQRNMMQGQLGANPMQLQAQAQAQAHAQVQAQAQAQGMMAGGPRLPNGQMAPGGMRPQPGMPQPQQMRMPPPEQFMKNLVAFMNTKNLPLDVNPVADGRPVNLFNLFQVVFNKMGGYRNVTQNNIWSQVAGALGYPPQQAPSSAPQLKSIYERNLYKFEEMYRMRAQQQQQQQAGMPNPQGMQPTPTKPMPQPVQQPPQILPGAQQQLQQPMQSPIKPPGQQQANANGFPGPHTPHAQQPPNAQGHSRNSLSRTVQPTPSVEEFSLASPAQSKAGSISLPGSAHPENQGMAGEAAASMRFPAPFASHPDEYMPCSREISTYGGVDPKAIEKVAEDLRHSRFDVPAPIELGMVDIHALARSIESGISGEVRLALDTLASLTCADHHNHIPVPQIDLQYCDDLVETLVECAEEQADLLAENSEEASNEVTIPLYEDVVRACRIERLALRKISLLGTPAHDLDSAVDRLICITTILRNLSDPSFPTNQKALADETVIKFLCVVIRYLGTREMLMRTNVDTLDLMKDIVMLLSNIAAEVVIPGREQAFCLLQFLLAFAPTPIPTLSVDTLFFTPYDPALHPYLPYAVDALAKLLARDEPNRTFYKTIFAADAVSSSSPGELLTRTFGLAISPVPPPGSIPLSTPEQPRDPRPETYDVRPSNFPSLIEVRKPFLMQGLLAADIIASLAPGHETGITRSWLGAGNGLAQNLFHLVRQLSLEFERPMRSANAHPRGQARKDSELVYIVRLAVSMLKRLSEKARDPNNPLGSVPASALPAEDNVLLALQLQAQEWTKEGMLADLVAFSSL